MYDVDKKWDVMFMMWIHIVEFAHVHIYTFDISLPPLSPSLSVFFALLFMTFSHGNGVWAGVPRVAILAKLA